MDTYIKSRSKNMDAYGFTIWNEHSFVRNIRIFWISLIESVSQLGVLYCVEHCGIYILLWL